MRTPAKELTPVIYNSAAIKVLHFHIPPHKGCFRSHWHDRLELLRIRRGSLFVGGSGTVEAGADTLVLIPPHTPHKGWTGDQAVEYDVLMFDVRSFYNETEVCKAYLPALYESRLAVQRLSGCGPLLDCMDELCREGLSPMAAAAEIYRLLALLFEYCLQELPLDQKRDAAARAFVTYLEEHSAQELSVGELSRRFGYSREHFCRKFKEFTGLSPMQYLKIFRVEEGYRLIKGGERNVGKIAAMCGFSDANYFTRCFKAHFGFPPSRALNEE